MSAVLDALAAAGDAGDVALGYAGRSLTRGELGEAIDRTADALCRQGLVSGDAVGVVCAHPLDAVVLTLATRRAEAVACPLAPGTSPPSPLRWRASLEAGVPAVQRLRDGVPLPAGTAWLRATSGSSGSMRFIATSEEQALAALRRSGALLGLEPGDAIVSSVAPWTSYGWSSAVLGPLVAGAEVRLVSPLAPRDLLAPLTAGSVSWAVTTAPVVSALARLSPAAGSGRARVLVSTAPYPLREAEALSRTHRLDVINRYGATEAGPIAQAREPLGPLYAAPGVDVRPAGDPAVLEVRSDGVGIGEVGGAPHAGVFRTADRAKFDPDGGFRLTGRMDRVVRRAGRPVDLAHVETTLAGLPGVALARVQVTPGRIDCDLQADVVPTADARLDGEALLRELSRHLEPWERPRGISVRERGDGGKWSAS
ncbi:MAG: AMP-binding protein [Planctomycetota bacterium]|jgi:acyl-coenzyme A synthetase/AMP-(fatty) acid ligase